MKILMLIDKMERGGAETHVLTLASSLVLRGHSVCIASNGGALTEEVLASGIAHEKMPLGSLSPNDMISCRRRLKKMLRSGGFDIVHSHARLASTLVSDIARRYDVCFVSTVHARFRLTRLRRRFSRWGQRTVAVSEDLKQYLVEEYGVPPENITVIPNGVDEKRFYPIRKNINRCTRIGFLSRLDGDCSLGAHLLCDIAPRLCRLEPDIEIIIGGAGEALSALSAHSASANDEIGRECVRCIGMINDVPEFMQKCDIFVGVSRAAIEAGLCSVPVILCGDEGFFGVLDEDNFNRALASNFCARGEVSACGELLYEAIAKLLLRGRYACNRDCEKVREALLKNCSAEGSVKKAEDFYRMALRKRDPKGEVSLLCGYYGFGNVGDDILLRAAIERAEREFPDPCVRALTKSGRKDSVRFGIECAKRSSPIALLREIRICRRLIFGGGTLLQCNTSLRSMIYYSSLLMLARMFGHECILWGNGIGQTDRFLFRYMLKKALGCCDFLGMRDTRSYAITRCLAGNSRAVLEKDLAEAKCTSYSTRERADYLLSRAFGKACVRFIAVMPRICRNNTIISTLVSELARARTEQIRILVIPMHELEDAKICRELCEALEAKMLSGICFDDLVMILERCERVYSMRYHGLVAAKLARVDFVGVGDDEKITGYCRENGGRVLDVEGQ